MDRCTDLPILYDMFWHFFDMLWCFFDSFWHFLTDRRIDGQTDLQNLDVIAPARSLKRNEKMKYLYISDFLSQTHILLTFEVSKIYWKYNINDISNILSNKHPLPCNGIQTFFFFAALTQGRNALNLLHIEHLKIFFQDAMGWISVHTLLLTKSNAWFYRVHPFSGWSFHYSSPVFLLAYSKHPQRIKFCIDSSYIIHTLIDEAHALISEHLSKILLFLVMITKTTWSCFTLRSIWMICDKTT